MSEAKNKAKVLLIGWDAADWKVINTLIEEGLMPNLERFINAGVMANLATLDPPYSPMLWTSIATGKRPYKHGVLGFHEPWDKGTGLRPVMSTTRKVKAVWNILSQEDYKTHVVGWWPSHPAEPINGIMISDFYQKATGRLFESWDVAEGAVFPKSMEQRFAELRVHPEELTAAHLAPFVPNYSQATKKQIQKLISVNRETAMAASLHAAFTNIIRTEEWDFAAIYLATIDHYSHMAMKYHPPKRPHIPQEDYDMFNKVIQSGYRFHDLMLGRILEMVDENTYVMLISDHGFQPDHLRPKKLPNEPAGPAYEHSPQGIFVMKGPGVKQDEIIYGASLLDITPTILACYDLPIAKDMDGKVLTQVFEEEKELTIIDTWEGLDGKRASGMHADSLSEDENVAERALEQLVALGYIEKPSDDKAKNQKFAQDENDFNLARAYIDGGLIGEAIPLLEKLYKEDIATPRYGIRLASCYQLMGKFKDCRQVIETLREREFYNSNILDVMEGGLLLGENRPIEAIKLLKKAEGTVNAFHSRMNMQIASAYISLRRWEDAERALKAEIELDYDNPQAHALLGKVYLNDSRFEDAINALINAIGLQYEYPNAHLWLGVALRNIGDYKRAADAFEVVLIMEPHAGKVRSDLIELYEQRLNLPEKAAQHRAALDTEILGTITIVSGLPRSGTSMMMQMLDNGGMDIFTDKERTPDDNNPKGYYEHEAVKTLARNKKWLKEADGKAVKVIANLLLHLPERFKYRIIFMERDLDEVLRSQRKMLERLKKKVKDDVYPLTLMQEFERIIQRVKAWAERNEHVEMIYINHHDVIENPFEQALRINDFLHYELLPELMANAVDSKLYRERNSPINS